MSDFVIIAGMSGAGRSQVGNNLEDLGWSVIDNLPPELIPQVADLARDRGAAQKVALAMGSDPSYDDIAKGLEYLRSTGSTVRVLFLDASTDVLVRRYESTKRRHPQESSDRLEHAIERERERLQPIRAAADLVIDTSARNVHELRRHIVELFAEDELDGAMQTTVMSFGFKFGLPADVDMVIDCRFLTNPYWDESLRDLTGLDQEVIDYLRERNDTVEFLDRLEHLLDMLLPAYQQEGKSYLTIAMGCTGGRHRSVAMAEALRDRLSTKDLRLQVHHRDIEK